MEHLELTHPLHNVAMDSVIFERLKVSQPSLDTVSLFEMLTNAIRIFGEGTERRTMDIRGAIYLRRIHNLPDVEVPVEAGTAFIDVLIKHGVLMTAKDGNIHFAP